jgi:hypothetical protein
LLKLKLVSCFVVFSLWGCADECRSDVLVTGSCLGCDLPLDTTTIGVPTVAQFTLDGDCASSVSGVVLLEPTGQDVFRLFDLVFPAESESGVGSFAIEGASDETDDFRADLLIQNTKSDDELHSVVVTVVP